MTETFGLRDRCRFERRRVDANGDRLGEWGDSAFDRPADIGYLRGGEGVQQQRLAGLQPVIITVRTERAVRALDGAWRAVSLRDQKIYDIKSANPAKDRQFVEILAVEAKGDVG